MNAHLLLSLTANTRAQPPPVPASPADLAAQEVTQSQVDLKWGDRSSNEDGFEIQRKTGTGSCAMLTWASPNAVSFSDTSVQKDVIYTSWMLAHNAAGASAASNEATVKVSCPKKGKGTRCR